MEDTMDNRKLKYEFTQEEVNFILNAINEQHISGIEPAQILTHIVDLLKNPLNINELKVDRRKPQPGT